MQIIEPDFMALDDWRAVVKNNAGIERVLFLIEIEADDTWIPNLLRDLGFPPILRGQKKS